MDKLKGFGGWRRKNGNGIQEERGEYSERLLVQQLTKYQIQEKQEVRVCRQTKCERLMKRV